MAEKTAGALALKRCSGCHAEKPLFEFHLNKRSPDGHLQRCKECRRTLERENRAAVTEKERLFFQRNPEARRRKRERYAANNPEKAAAHKAVEKAVRAGELIKASQCEDCGAEGPLHGHHEDYGKPLEVDWLCTYCHVEADRRWREGGREDRRRRYQEREKYAAQMRQHVEGGASIPGDLGGHKRGRKPWDADEEARVLDHAVPDRQLAEELGRSQKAITARRWQIKERDAAFLRSLAAEGGGS